MASRNAGSLVAWGLVLGLMAYLPNALAQEAPAHTPPASSNLSLSTSTAGHVLLAAEPSEAEPQGELVAVMLPLRRFGFEQLRRRLPYGTIHNPVIRYLTDDIESPADDD